MSEHRIWIEFHQFAIAPAEDVAPIPNWQGIPGDPPLAAPTQSGDGVVVLTGVAVGPVEVNIGSIAEGGVDRQWTERAEVRIDLSAPLVIEVDGAEPITVFTPHAKGPHVVRVWAAGRDENWDLSLQPDSRDTPEQYLLEFDEAI